MADNKIILLKGPERIRKRPAVVFGSDGLEGVRQMVCHILQIFVTEARLGYCRYLQVKQVGATLEISGDDRGLYLGQDTGEDTTWQAIFCEMYPASAYAPDESGYCLGLTDYNHNTLFGDKTAPNGIYYPDDNGYFELYCAQCASRQMDVVVNRKGIRSALHFEKGHNIGGITHTRTDAGDGTCFCFTVDDAVFSKTVLSAAWFRKTLQTCAMLSPGLCCTYTRGNGKTERFFYENGLRDYVKEKSPDSPASIYRSYVWGKGRERYNLAEYEACVELVIGYTPNVGEVKVYHNFRELPCGGRHLEVLKKKLVYAFNSAYAPEKSITFRELSRHLTVVLTSNCTKYCSCWENGTRKSIGNQVIADMTADALNRDFDNYLYDWKEPYSAMVEEIISHRKK